MKPTHRRVAFGLSYYYPYVSGLTNAAKVIAEQLVERGWQVTVVASQHDATLPRRELVNGVDVLRAPVIGRVSKAVLSPTLPIMCAREIRRAGRGNLHLPFPDAGAVAVLVGRRADLTVTYQCDVVLESGMSGRALARALDTSSRLALSRSRVNVVSSLDYMSSSRLARQLGERAVEIAPPSVERPPGKPTYRSGDGLHVGFLGRIVEEKGIPYLVEAFRAVASPNWRLMIGGEFQGIAGGSRIEEVRQAAEEDPRVSILGFIPDDGLADFYASMDVFAFPSINPLEAFGIAQVEAMFAGVPVVASDLPGVRQPVLRTGMGALARPRDSADLGRALLEVAATPSARWEAGREEARKRYSLSAIVDAWEQLLLEPNGGLLR